jgi:hypothetical protein
MNKETAWQDIDRSTALALPASRVYILWIFPGLKF